MAPSHTMNIEVALPPAQAEAAVYSAFLGAGLNGVNGGWGQMRGTMPMSWLSWGEDVQAWITPGPRGSVLQLRSESSMPTTLVDWGKNRKNLERVVDALRPLVPVAEISAG